MMRDRPRLWTPRRQPLWVPKRHGVCDLLGITNLIGFGGGGADSYSVNFDGSNDYLEIADNAAWAYGTGAFTLEGFFRWGTVPSSKDLFGRYNTGAGTYGMLSQSSATQFYWYYGNGASFGFASSTIGASTWYHYAICRDGSSNLRFFVGGTQQGSTQSDSANYSGSAVFRIAAAHQTSMNYFAGDCSNFRVVKGSALYTANFTPPPAPLQAVTNTVLLTCQDGTIRDNSSNGFSITNSGGATVIADSPFG